MNQYKRTTAAAILTMCFAVAGGGSMAQRVLAQETPESFDTLQKLIAPGPNESQWMQVPWMPSSNIYAARKKAATEGKPLLLWYMAGEPLGTC